MKRRFGAPDLFQDVGGFGGPDERLRDAIVLFNVRQDGTPPGRRRLVKVPRRS